MSERYTVDEDGCGRQEFSNVRKKGTLISKYLFLAMQLFLLEAVFNASFAADQDKTIRNFRIG